MKSNSQFKNKVVLVTGAGSGMGAAIARRFAKAGAITIVADIDEVNGLEVAREIIKSNNLASFFKLDIRDENSWKEITKDILEKYGVLNILVNSAGAYIYKAICETSLEEWKLLMTTNLDSVFLSLKYSVPILEKTPGSSIINISSTGADKGLLNTAAYCASKGGVKSLTRTVALEFAKLKNPIRINAINPGLINTPMVEKFQKNSSVLLGLRMTQQFFRKLIFKNIIKRNIPWNRMGEPDEIADAVLFLASDKASYITGSEIIVDGGYTAG